MIWSISRVWAFFAGWYCLSIFGSRSSSATSTTSIDKRVVADEGSTAVSADTVHMLDAGAINSVFDFAKQQNESNERSFLEVLGLAHDAVKTSMDTVSGSGVALAEAYDKAKGEGDLRVILYAVLVGMVGIVGVIAYMKRGG